MGRNNARESLRRKGSKRLLRARPEQPSAGRLMISRCAQVARAKGLPAVITPEEVRGAAQESFVAINAADPHKREKPMGAIYRQGDVLFKKLALAPRGERKVRSTGHILEGEATGHIHRVAELESATVFEIEDGLFLNVTAEGGVAIVHEEHDPITLPAGDYEVVRQREYSPEEIRNVVD